jgi:hypothetical protein
MKDDINSLDVKQVCRPVLVIIETGVNEVL